MVKEKIYRVVGVMSGTSLDGLDLVLCEFVHRDGIWRFRVLKGKTVSYSDKLKRELGSAQKLSAYDFVELHRRYGAIIGEEVKKFVGEETNIDFVASHGHTVFHEPDKQVTFQVGCGAQIAARSGLKTISDFRTLDIALGGQGAPLVPVGDKLLFFEYDACVNLGGFANVSYERNNERIAFDICPVNIVLNDIVSRFFNRAYDDKGALGRQGNLNEELLAELNALPFYDREPPKSLAREWVENQFNSIIARYDHTRKNHLLTTCYFHFAQQIAKVLNDNDITNALFTGGGSFNSYLMELIASYTKTKVVIPDKQVIDFKEALIFAFLGVLREEGQVNCLSSVTGAKIDNIGGSVYLG